MSFSNHPFLPSAFQNHITACSWCSIYKCTAWGNCVCTAEWLIDLVPLGLTVSCCLSHSQLLHDKASAVSTSPVVKPKCGVMFSSGGEELSQEVPRSGVITVRRNDFFFFFVSAEPTFLYTGLSFGRVYASSSRKLLRLSFFVWTQWCAKWYEINYKIIKIKRCISLYHFWEGLWLIKIAHKRGVLGALHFTMHLFPPFLIHKNTNYS